MEDALEERDTEHYPDRRVELSDAVVPGDLPVCDVRAGDGCTCGDDPGVVLALGFEVLDGDVTHDVEDHADHADDGEEHVAPTEEAEHRFVAVARAEDPAHRDEQGEEDTHDAGGGRDRAASGSAYSVGGAGVRKSQKGG